VPSIGLAAGARIAQAPALPPAPAPGAAGRRCKAAPGTVRDFSTPLPRAQAPGASTVRGHIYLAQSTPVLVVVRARRTPQCPPLRYTSPAISQTAKRRNFGFIDPTNRGQSLPSKCDLISGTRICRNVVLYGQKSKTNGILYWTPAFSCSGISLVP